jgi:hypothetical protein
MVYTDGDNGWDLAKNKELLVKVFGGYPSFHDAFVSSICMQRGKRCREPSGSASTDRHGREIVDLELEILHNRFGPLDAAGTDYLVVLILQDVKVANIDVNAMLQDSWVMNMTLSRQADGLLTFDLEPNIGLDLQVTCAEVTVLGIRPYTRVAS